MRGESCVGLLIVEGSDLPRQDAFSASCKGLCDGIVVAYDREFTHNLLQEPQVDLKFREAPNEFFASLATHVARSARMQFVAIRELDKATSSLVTLAVHGLNSRDLRRYDLESLSRFPSFQEALDGRTPVPSNTHGPELEALHEIEELKDVRSFVVAPLQTADTLLGVLSGASKYAYDYSGNEILGFTNLAQHVAVSLSYFRSSQTQREQLMELTETAAAFTGIEVASAVRHGAKLQVANVTSRIDNVGSAFKQGKSNVGHERLKKVKTDTQALYETLDQLKLVTIPPNRTSELIGVQTLINEALSAASANLRQRGIGFPEVTGPDVKVLVYRDWLRQVIVNLLLNSLDAYGARRASQGSKEIAIRIGNVASRAKTVHIQYRDNAGGLQPHKLSRPDGEAIKDPDAAIFDKGVTSKKTGTGYGLWLARSIMTEHGGSINLVDHRGGMTFALELPVPNESPLPPPKIG
jgi:signal transduction histidine kinase